MMLFFGSGSVQSAKEDSCSEMSACMEVSAFIGKEWAILDSTCIARRNAQLATRNRLLSLDVCLCCARLVSMAKVRHLLGSRVMSERRVKDARSMKGWW